MSNTHPHLMQSFLVDIEPSVVRTLTTFRTELARPAEVCGQPTATLAGSSSDGATSFEVENATDRIPSIWADKCPADSPKTLAASNVVLLPDLLGDANSSPFHSIVTNCDASVFESKLLQLIVQHKWEANVRSHRMRSIALHGTALVVRAVAMVTSVTRADSDAVSMSSNTADALQGLVVVIEVASLGAEAFELVSKSYGPTPFPFLHSVLA